MYYLFLKEESLFVLDSIPKVECLKISKDVAKDKMKAKLNLIQLNFEHRYHTM